MKKITAIIIAAAMLLGCTGVFAESFTDISGHWAEADIISAQERGIVNGDGTGAFRPNDNVSRAEFVKMVSALMADWLGFDDVPEDFGTTDDWYSKYYDFALSVYLGYDIENTVDGVNPGVFNESDAQNPISRWEMAYISASLMNVVLGREVSTEAEFADMTTVNSYPGLIPYAISLCAENGVMQGGPGGAFNPAGTGSRAEAVVIVGRLDKVIEEYVAEQDAIYAEAAARVEAIESSRVTYADSEIPKEHVKVKFEMENGGSFTAELYPEYAPQTVANFVKLVNEGFYDGLTFHRVMDGFMAQGGDPDGDGTGNSGGYIFGEFLSNDYDKNELLHEEGTISMARSSITPNSASCQFFICYDTLPSLDGEYAAFGKVIEGMDTVKAFLEIERVANENGEISSPVTPIVIKKASVVK